MQTFRIRIHKKHGRLKAADGLGRSLLTIQLAFRESWQQGLAVEADSQKLGISRQAAQFHLPVHVPVVFIMRVQSVWTAAGQTVAQVAAAEMTAL
jgi:hypothetical protein